MKKLSHILTTILCCAPFGLAHGAPVASTAGSNLTAFEPSNAYNNQWATMSNGRYDANNNKKAKADFGNCNSVVLRCATSKCSGTGCADENLAKSIVEGCVKSNESCKQYGDDLVQFMTAQLVANANAKINEQNIAMQQAAAEAQAAATAAASAQSQQQMAMMQQQMQQMQEQMQQQQAESARQLQEALSQQQAQSQQALADMKTAATTAAVENESGVSAYQQDAINRGIGLEVLERKKITGQIMTEIEDSEVLLKKMKTAMQNSFEYAHCDTHGNNCEGPKRVKKWRELARDFIDPYDESIEKIYTALETAQLVGVDMSQIYMMLNDSCNSWGQYMCPNLGGNTFINYNYDNQGNKNEPSVCPQKSVQDIKDCKETCNIIKTTISSGGGVTNEIESRDPTCVDNCSKVSGCVKCSLMNVLTDGESVYEGWVNADTTTNEGNTTVVACASGVLNKSRLLGRRSKKKSGADLIDIDTLEMWINQVEPNISSSKATKNSIAYGMAYCHDDTDIRTLQSAMSKRSVKVRDLCFNDTPNIDGYNNKLKGTPTDNLEECAFIKPTFAICDVHPYNAGYENGERTNGSKEDDDCRKKRDAQRSNNQGDLEHALSVMAKGRGCMVYQCDQGWKPSKDQTTCEECSDGDGNAEGSAKCGVNEQTMINSLIAQYQNEMGEDEVREVIGLKVSVLSQQMYKQYEYLNSTIRRLRTQLEKSVLSADLAAAGAKSEDGGGSSAKSLLGAGKNSDKTIHLAGAENCTDVLERESQWRCLQSNASLVKNTVDNDKKNSCLQLQDTLKYAETILKDNKVNTEPGSACAKYKRDKFGDKQCGDLDRDNIRQCASAITNAVIAEKEEKEEKKNQLRFVTGM